LAKRTQTRFLARTIVGSKPSALPGFVPPQFASLMSKPPAGDNWLREVKYDGYRLQVHLDKGRVTIRTRTGLDWTKRFSAIARRSTSRSIGRSSTAKSPSNIATWDLVAAGPLRELRLG